MTTATLGNADMQRLKMSTVKGEPEWRALTSEQQIVEMPIAIELKEFIMETYDDGSPKRFASDIQILTQTGKNIETTVEVNKPVEVDGWKIYQYGYDTQMGAMSQTSILELVSDPWLPLVYTGIYMMLAGAVLMILRAIPWRQGVQQARQHPKTAFLLCAVIAACFFCVHHFMPILHSNTLVPALQSPWFKPHIIAYMLAYTLMASAAVIAMYLLLRSKRGNLDHLVFVGISLITIGMLFGALWAKEAWGHYWSWDPKETWAAITWFAYLVYVHYRQLPTHKPRLALCVLLISFVLLQMCWWGINYLPSAQGSSVHVYSM
jgi:ABC-type transport system involved in cytochrome c biogenesis permease subunit